MNETTETYEERNARVLAEVKAARSATIVRSHEIPFAVRSAL